MTGTSWKAILWKEWRENLRWGILALLGVAIALVYTVSSANPLGDGGQADKCATLWNAAYLVMTFGCPLIAAALGFAQVMPELRRDQWAFLVHRPIQWSVLFGGKAVVGISPSVVAAGLPFLLFVLWTATPGTVPIPFDARLALPGVASLLTIVPCYFAGMLTALRPARWYGSRALALPAAIAAVQLTTVLPEFWGAAVAVLVFGAVLAAAAWGSFLTRGQYQGQPRTAQIGLSVSLYIGTVVVTITLIMLAFGLASSLLPQGSTESGYTYYNLTTDGKVLRLTQFGQQRMTATDLAGKPVTLPRSSGGYFVTNSLPTASLLAPGNDVSSYEARGSGTYRSTSRLISSLGTSIDSSDSTFWYYVPRERRALGYRKKTRQLTGFLGPAGLSPLSDINSPRFEANYPRPQSWDSTGVFQFRHTVYWMDATVPVVTRIYKAGGMGDIQGACLVSGQYASPFDSTVPRAVIVAASNEFHAYTPQGATLFTLRREYDTVRYGNVTVAMTPDRKHFFFWYNPSDHAAKKPGTKLPSHITEVSSAGIVQSRYTLPPLPENPSTPIPLSVSALGPLAPPVSTLALVGYLEIGHQVGNADTNSLRDSLYEPRALPVWHLFLVISAAGGLLSAMLAWLIARRCVLSVRVRWLWAVGIFWLGLYGALMLLALREWPAQMPCPNCGRQRVVDREQCEHCGAPFARPVRDGTEIFDTEKTGAMEKVAR